jgi:hypothetical protein
MEYHFPLSYLLYFLSYKYSLKSMNGSMSFAVPPTKCAC